MPIAQQLAAIRQHDLRQAEFVSTVADAIAHNRNLVARMKRIFGPAGLSHTAGARPAGAPFLDLAFVDRHVEIHPYMRITKIEPGYGAGHRRQIFHVIAAPGVMSEDGSSRGHKANGESGERQNLGSHCSTFNAAECSTHSAKVRFPGRAA